MWMCGKTVVIDSASVEAEALMYLVDEIIHVFGLIFVIVWVVAPATGAVPVMTVTVPGRWAVLGTVLESVNALSVIVMELGTELAFECVVLAVEVLL